MEITTVLGFALAAVTAIVIPGPTVLLALSNGSRFGLRRSLSGVAGGIAADVVMVTLVGFGLGALLAASETAFMIVKWIGVAYLGYIGIRMLFARGHLAAPTGAGGRGTRGALFAKSFLVSVTNPKGYLFFTALLPQFLVPGVPQVIQYVVLGLVFCAIDFAVMSVYPTLGSRAIALLRRRAAVWIERGSGAVILGVAAWLATARRATA